MSNELSGYNVKQPLASAPLSAEIISVDAPNRVCSVQVQSMVVDNVTWFGVEPAVGDIVYLTDTGDRLVIVAPRPDDADLFVNTNGDTMTGYLTLPGTPLNLLHAATKKYVDDGDAAVSGKSVQAGSGLYGGGTVAVNPTLHVGAGHQIEVGADAVGLITGAQSISDWNAAVYNGFYMAAGAANGPSSVRTGWWYGWTVCHNDAWCTQFALPFAQVGIDGAALMSRHKENGAWGPWFRVVNYGALSWDALDNFIYLRHNGDSSNAAVSATSRWAIGNKKGASTTAPSDDDQFRIQRYNSAGSYAGNLMTGTTAGVVNFPGGHSLLAQAMEEGTEVEADRAATVGIVAGMIMTALDNLGLITPEARAKADALFGLRIGEASPDFDPTSVEPEPEPTPDSGLPPEDTLTPPEEAQP